LVQLENASAEPDSSILQIPRSIDHVGPGAKQRARISDQLPGLIRGNLNGHGSKLRWNAAVNGHERRKNMVAISIHFPADKSRARSVFPPAGIQIMESSNFIVADCREQSLAKVMERQVRDIDKVLPNGA
jgi:hypothetical protein